MTRRKVLIVDDQERNIRLLSSLVQGVGHDTLTAIDGRQACRAVAEEKPDLVLLDAMMPGMSGFEVCAWIRGQEESKLLPVVMVTALHSMDEKIRALEIGADDFLSKPINRLELQAKVKSLLRVRALQEDLSRKNAELRRSESLRESLTQMIVHDLKNPLTAIQGHLDLLASQPELNSKVERLTRSSRKACRTMMDMILDMLDVGRLEEGCNVVEAKRMEVGGLIHGTIEECSGLAEAAEVRIVSEIPEPGPTVLADPGLIRRVVANLLNNAIKHTPPGGRVTVGSRDLGDWMELRVGDTGEGIPAEEIDRIFDKFSRVMGQRHATRQDRGLGLTFCKMAVEAHGGHIRAESAPGRGSVFSFTLPATSRSTSPTGRQNA